MKRTYHSKECNCDGKDIDCTGPIEIIRHAIAKAEGW